MRIQLLPSTFNCAGGIALEQRLTCFVIDDCVCVDAGSIALGLCDEQRARVRDIIITHVHIDHIASLPIFIDDMAAILEEPIRLHATVEVIESLERNVFNGMIYPRFSKISNGKCRLLQYVPIQPGRQFSVRHLRVTPVDVNHTVPTVGLIVSDATSTVAFTSDTAETENIWQCINDIPRVDALIIETSFPNEMDKLARLSGHLTPDTLAREMCKLEHENIDVLTVHLKPMFRKALVEELAALAIPRLRVMEPGCIYEW